MPRPSLQCCVVGGGPAGVMLGFLLARAGVEVVVLEKHADFFRDFRGDTIHPSTLDVLHELGLLEEFLKLPHSESDTLGGVVSGREIQMADFRFLPTRCKFIAFVPQWDFLNFITGHARKLPTFRILMRAEATDIIEENGRVVGVKVKTPEGEKEIRATLVIGADGRHSVIRQKAGFEVQDIGAPMDVLWLRISRKPADPKQSLGYLEPGKMFVTIERGDYWQCGFIIPKGMFDEMKSQGLEKFRASIASLVPYFKDRVGEVKSWDDVKLLTVAVDRLHTWYRPGLLCIGDSAHAMSPVGGVGINLAIQDAVAAANILAGPLREGTLSLEHLKQVQVRRTLPVVLTQKLQVFIQKRVIGHVLNSGQKTLSLAWPVRLMQQFPILQRIPARIVGMGFRPEHVHTTLR